MSADHEGIDLRYLDAMSGGDPDMRNTLLDMLVEELPRELATLLQAAECGDVPAIFQSSHSLKSSLAYTGSAVAIGLNDRIEAAARRGVWGVQEQEALHELAECMAGLTEALRLLSR